MLKVKNGFSMFLIAALILTLFAPNATTVHADPEASINAEGSAEVYTYSQPAKYQPSTDYELKVNGEVVPVIKAFSDYDYAHFSASEGKLTYELTILNTDKVHEYSISPLKLGITASKVEGRTITFTTDKPEYLIVMMNSRARRMVIAGDQAETNAPAPSGEGVYNITDAPYGVTPNVDIGSAAERTAAIQQAINDASAYGSEQGDGTQGIVYVPAGQYYIGNLVLKSNTALYLAPGAAFIGTGKADDYTRHWFKDSKQQPVTWWISTEFDSDNIKIYGRGTLDANGGALTGDRSSATHTKGMINNVVVPIATQNFTMDGIIVRESSAWAVTPVRSNDMVFSNLKIFNSLGMSENDGIDVNESQNVTVKNVIGIALDDPFSTKAWNSETDIANGTVTWPGAPEPVDNVLFEDLIAWTLCYGYKVGQGVEQNQSNITFRNGVVYRAAVGFGVHHKWGAAEINNVTFENMDVEQIRGKNDDNSSWMTLHTIHNSSGVGPIHNVTARNITVREIGETFGKVLGHPDAPITNVTFDHVYMPDKNSPTKVSSTPATRLVELNFLLLENYENVKILPWQNREPRAGGNLALNKPAFISENDKPEIETAHLAFDGKMDTRAGTARTDSEWLYVDLGAKQVINEVRLYWEGAYGKIYQIRVSDDAENWTTVFSTENGDGGTDIILFDDIEARYVQMFGILRGSKYGYSLWEFEVYRQDFTSYDVVLDKRELTLEVDEQEQLTATVLPDNTIDKSVVWSSSNEQVATVDESGLVTAIAPGTAEITVVTNDTGLDAHAIVTVLGDDNGGGDNGGGDNGGGDNGGGDNGGGDNNNQPEPEPSNEIVAVDNEVSEAAITEAFAAHDDIVIITQGGSVNIPATALLSVDKPNAVFTVQTEDGSLSVPLSVLRQSDVVSNAGQGLSVQIRVKKVSEQLAEDIADQVIELGGKPLADSVDFEVSVVTEDGEEIIIHSFGSTYVSRTIPLRSPVDPNKATGVLYNPESGELSFVPAVFTDIDGQLTAVLKRTSNSIYTVISVDKSFGDIKGYWAQSDIELMANKLIVNGVTEQQFDPNRDITRAEFAAMLIRSLGLSHVETATSFSDVPQDAWYADDIAIAADAGLIRGYADGTFRANQVISREELAAMIMRAAEYAGAAIQVSDQETTVIMSRYADSGAIKWGHKELAAAIKAGYMKGTDGDMLAPEESATRAQAAAMIKRYLLDVDFITVN